MIKKVKDFNKKNNRKLDVYSRILDVQSEIGELAKEVLKSTKYGEKEFEKTNDFTEEFGDVLYSLISFGLECGVDVENSVDVVLKKYQSLFYILEYNGRKIFFNEKNGKIKKKSTFYRTAQKVSGKMQSCTTSERCVQEHCLSGAGYDR